jgi:Endonuclease V
MASHLGVVLDCPTIGCARSILVGVPKEPGNAPGSWAPLVYRGETIAAVFRTREGRKPMYVSQGHRVALESAIRFARGVSGDFRIPRPTREADHFVGQVKLNQEQARLPASPRGEKIKREVKAAKVPPPGVGGVIAGRDPSEALAPDWVFQQPGVLPPVPRSS